MFVLMQGGTLSLVGTVTLPAPTVAWHATCTLKTPTFVDIPADALAVTLGAGVAVGDSLAYPIELVGTSAQSAQWPLGELVGNLRFHDEADPPVVIPTLNFSLEHRQGATNA